MKYIPANCRYTTLLEGRRGGRWPIALAGAWMTVLGAAVVPAGARAAWQGETIEARRLCMIEANGEGGINAAALGPDGDRVATAAGLDGRVRLWSAETGEPGIEAAEGGRQVTCLAIDPERGRFLAAGRESSLRLTDLGLAMSYGRPSLAVFAFFGGHEVNEFRGGEDGSIRAVAFGRDERLVAGLGSDYVLRIWRIDTGEQLVHLGAGDMIGDAAGRSPHVMTGFDTDLRRVASVMKDGQTCQDVLDQREGTITLKLWDVDELSFRAIDLKDSGIGGQSAVAVRPGGDLVATGAGPHTIRIWLWENAEVFRTMEADGALPCIMTFATIDNRRTLLASGDVEGVVRLWSVDHGRLLATIAGPEGMPVLGLAFLDDGRRLRYLVGDYGNRPLEVWEADLDAIIGAPGE